MLIWKSMWGCAAAILEEWIDRVPNVSDMREMMNTLLIFMIIARSGGDNES